MATHSCPVGAPSTFHEGSSLFERPAQHVLVVSEGVGRHRENLPNKATVLPSLPRVRRVLVGVLLAAEEENGCTFVSDRAGSIGMITTHIPPRANATLRMYHVLRTHDAVQGTTAGLEVVSSAESAAQNYEGGRYMKGVDSPFVSKEEW